MLEPSNSRQRAHTIICPMGGEIVMKTLFEKGTQNVPNAINVTDRTEAQRIQ